VIVRSCSWGHAAIHRDRQASVAFFSASGRNRGILGRGQRAYEIYVELAKLQNVIPYVLCQP